MISVCMATYNGERFIKKQLDSILLQLSENDEIIISDDGSTDNTIKILEKYNDHRIKIFHHDKRISKFYPKSKIPIVSFNFENALIHASGDYIFLSDQDDIWYPEKILKCCDLLSKFDLVLSNTSIIDEDDKMLIERYEQKSPLGNTIIKNIIKAHIWGCCLAFNRNILLKSLPFPKSICVHDLWLGLIAQKFGTITFYDEPLIYHRIWSANTSQCGRKSTNSLYMKIKYRLLMLIAIVFRR